MEKLIQCRVECLSKFCYLFVKSKSPLETPGYLVIDDPDSRPDVVLIMRIENGEFIFETTDKTYLVEGKRQP